MTHKIKITFAFCTYNRADRLEKLITAMRAQTCSFPFEILAINNNSQDNTLEELQRLAIQSGAPLRFVTETVQGIVAARNRAIDEAMGSDILIFIDDDEIPLPGLLEGACQSILNDGADCVGGRVIVDFSGQKRPDWLSDDLLGFLAEVNHGDQDFWIKDEKTPIWTANVAYNMGIFTNNPEIRFDKRYDRIGNVIGGGSDLMLFKSLVNKGFKLRYCSNMAVLHSVEPWRLHRRYFLKLHFLSGYRTAFYETLEYKQGIFGIPFYLFIQTFKQFYLSLTLLLKSKPYMRQTMNFTHALGLMYGCYSRWKSAH
ncbi:hypothetical protein MTYM_01624 [Methylococcales bacterium]|nr:hypothetical protein MTYM_01624 [Methylococcales bacterium]